MNIKKIYISNFRSIKKLEVELSRFNVLIGPNAAGKSNFIHIFKFIKDIAFLGLENAISLQGGADYIRNFNLSSDDMLFLRFVAAPDKDFKFSIYKKNKYFKLAINEFDYSFSIKFNHNDYDFKITKDSLVQRFRAFLIDDSTNTSTHLGSGSFELESILGKFQISFNTEEIPELNEDDYQKAFLFHPEEFIEKQRFLRKEEIPSTLLLSSPLFFIPYFEIIKKDIESISIYDFDPNLAKFAASLTGMSQLAENGENLAIVVKRILSDPDKSRKLLNLISDVLPFIEDLNVEKYLDKYLNIVIKEKYNTGLNVPSFILSEGTLFLLSLIIALYFEKKPFAIFEEPERRIHPYLISKLIDMMKDSSQFKQIVLSTHNPEIVKYAGIDNILFVTRNSDGFSTISKLHEKEEIKMFLKNEIGIEELYIQNLLD